MIGDDFAFYLARHEAAHAIVGRALGAKVELIEVHRHPTRGGGRTVFSNVPNPAALIVITYAGAIAEERAGACEVGMDRGDENDRKRIAEVAEANNFQPYHLEALYKIAMRLVDQHSAEIDALTFKLVMPGTYRFRGERLTYAARQR